MSFIIVYFAMFDAELKKRIQDLVGRVDGLIFVCPDEELSGFWYPGSDPNIVVTQVLGTAQMRGVKTFLDTTRGNLEPDTAWQRKIIQTRGKDGLLLPNIVHVAEYEYIETAKIVARNIKKPLKDIVLGFAGGMAISCVRKAAYALCREVEEPSEFATEGVDVIREQHVLPKNKKFGRGIIICELTDHRRYSLFISSHGS